MIRLNLRQKLFLVSSLILVVPWLGLRYVKAIEDYLQHILLDNLSTYAQSVTTHMSQQTDIIPVFPPGESMYAAALPNEPSLDGYDADWGDYSRKPRLLLDQQQSANATVKIGRYDDSLYLFMSIIDSDIRYHQSVYSLSQSTDADGIALDLNIGNEAKQLLLITEAPGMVYARDKLTGQRYSRIQGFWLEREQGVGYEVEFKIPIAYVAQGLNIRVNDLKAGGTTTYQLANERLSILSAPAALNTKLSQFGLLDGRRLRLLDNQGRLLASTGTLNIEQNLKPINPLFAWLLIPDEISDSWNDTTLANRDDVKSALRGEALSTRIRQGNDSSMLLTSAWPIVEQNRIKGVVLIEESTAALQVLQRSALASLLNVSLLIFLLLAVALITFAGRLSNRIRQLEKVTDSAIDEYGRVKGDLPELKRGDELDTLNNHVRDMLLRLRAYHDYLEKLASRLSHEIRTPVAVVRSSLENMQQQIDSHDNQPIQGNLSRAEQGIQRLQTLLHRMAEASRLEQSIHESESEKVALATFLSQMVKGYQSIYPTHQFQFSTDVEDITASPDLLAQALDKLVSNAVSFAESGSVITVTGMSDHQHCLLTVSNIGPQLPTGMADQLFQSMVSIRDNEREGNEPHLGLGLHIVQLVAEFHGGHTMAKNIDNGVSIGFSVSL